MTLESRVEVLVGKADALFQKGEWGDAFNIMTKACSLMPNAPSLYVRIGSYMVQMGHPPDRWIPMFEHAANLSGGGLEILTELGLAYCIAGNVKKAGETFKGIERMPGCPPLARNMLALLHTLEVRHDEAKSMLGRTLQSHPGDIMALYILAQYHELEGRTAEAESLLHRILEIDPQNKRAVVALRRLDYVSRQRRIPRGAPDGINPRSVLMLVEDRRVDRRVLDQAMSLQQAGWDVTVVAGEPPDVNPYWDEECYPDLRIMRVNEWTFSFYCFDNSFLYSIPYYQQRVDTERAKNDFIKTLPDPAWRKMFYERRPFFIAAVEYPSAVYVAHDLPQLPAATMAALYHGGKVFYDSHELFPEQSFVEKNRPMLSAMERHLTPLADRITVVNQSMADEFTERYGVDSKVILNCPSFDLSKLPIQRTTRLRDALGIPQGKRILLYQGNIVTKIRNLETIIEGMAYISREDVVLVLMGPDNGGVEDLIDLARKLGLLGTSVYFHPSVRQSDLLSYTVSADAGLIPYMPVDWNTKYCTPNKLYEFIVAELPILANVLPELNRFVGEQGIGMNIPMGSPREFASGVDAFFARDISEFLKTLATISPRFVWQNHEGPLLVSMYEEMLQEANIPNKKATRSDQVCAALPE